MRIDQLSLRRLKMFVEVVRHGGFSSAAKVAFATQPTVSKAVRQLEDELGVARLHPAGRRAQLTAAGETGSRPAAKRSAGRSSGPRRSSWAGKGARSPS